jgi:CBS domain-containing protein
MCTVRQILDRKGTDVATVDVEASVLDAARLMNERHIGAVVVMRHDKPAGIFTERDVMNRIVAAGRPPAQTIVKDVMTTPIACCRRDTKAAECRAVMKRNKIRHLPVVEDDRLYGMIAMLDVIEGESAEKDETIFYLHDYMYGTYR